MTDMAAVSRPGLIAPAAGTKGYEGAGILEAAMGVRDGIVEENLFSTLGNGTVVGLNALGAILDPFQAVFAAGVGWLMEHVDCLREPLDLLAGDPKEIEGHAATWRNLQKRTYEATGYFVDRVGRTATTWDSSAATAYRDKAAQLADGALALGTVADSIAEVTLIAGSIIGVVRNTVRDLIAEVLGAVISKAVQSVLVVTLPKVLAEIALMVVECAARIVKVLERLSDAIKALGSKMPHLADLCVRVSKVMDGPISDAQFSSLFLNSAKLHAADGYVADSQGAWAAFKSAYGSLDQAENVVYGTKARVAVDAAREGLKMNSLQNGGATADGLQNGEPHAPITDLPL